VTSKLMAGGLWIHTTHLQLNHLGKHVIAGVIVWGMSDLGH
jgi:hypothetical protein